MANRLNAPPITSRYQLSRLSLGKARSRAPIMIGRKKFPSTAGMDGIRKKKIIATAVHGEQLVVGLRTDQVALRRQQFHANQRGEGAADEEEQRDGGEIQQADALVVLGKEPRFQAVTGI